MTICFTCKLCLRTISTILLMSSPGIDHHRLVRRFIADDRAVALQDADRQDLMNHGIIVASLARTGRGNQARRDTFKPHLPLEVAGRRIQRGLGEASVAKYRQHGYQDRDRDNESERDRARGPAPAPRLRKGTTHLDHAPSTCRERAPSRGARSAEPYCREVREKGSVRSAASNCTRASSARTSILEADSNVCSRSRCGFRRKMNGTDCTFYEIRVTREKETSTPATVRPNDARAAFENLVQEINHV